MSYTSALRVSPDVPNLPTAVESSPPRLRAVRHFVPPESVRPHARSYGVTDIGQRERNEDSFGNDDHLGFYVVADGMGGRPFGGLASRIMVDGVCEWFRDPSHDPTLAGAVGHGCYQLTKAAVLGQGLNRMGTTVAALHLEMDHWATIVHAGDSRVYRWRAGVFERLTRDHNVPGDMVAEGTLSREEADRHPLGHVLTQFLSPEGWHEPTVQRRSAVPGDVFLLCTDGLVETMSDEALALCVAHGTSVESACCQLVRGALSRDTHDNVTAVVVRVLGDEVRG